MGTLGAYLKSAREALGVDLHEAAQQTRISIHYLDALENEIFTKLPGEVFVKGFLKNYARFLNLPESEVMKRYGEIRHPAPPAPVPGQAVAAQPVAIACEQKKTEETPLEPIVWGAVIFIGLIILLFSALPQKHREPAPHAGVPALPAPAVPGHGVGAVAKPEKLYLAIEALDDVWVLVRTDMSPQKKALLKKGETITWSADERFMLSYARIGAIKLSLNGKELTVKGPENAVVRDLAVTAKGIVSPAVPEERPRPPRPKPQAPAAPPAAAPQPAPGENQTAPAQPAAPDTSQPPL